MASLLDNLSIAWSGDFDSLKKFTSDELNLDGNWEHPGGNKKIFTSDNTSITWRRSKSVLNIESVDAGKITYLLCAKLCKNLDSTHEIPSINYSNSSCQIDSAISKSCYCKCTDVCTSIHELMPGQDTNSEAIQAIADSIIHITKTMTQFREDIHKSGENNRAKNNSNFMQELTHNHNTNEINEANNSSALDFSVSESHHQNNTNVTSQQKSPSIYNTPTPKHLVPCPCLRRKGHCLEGFICDLSHKTSPPQHLRFYQQQDLSSPFYKLTRYPYPILPQAMKYPICHLP